MCIHKRVLPGSDKSDIIGDGYNLTNMLFNEHDFYNHNEKDYYVLDSLFCLNAMKKANSLCFHIEGKERFSSGLVDIIEMAAKRCNLPQVLQQFNEFIQIELKIQGNCIDLQEVARKSLLSEKTREKKIKKLVKKVRK